MVNRDGSVDVTEQITFDYQGSFEGAWRDIPSRFGERVVPGSVTVGEEGVPYVPGGTTKLGTTGPANTYAVGPLDGGTRIVWRYRATNERRTYRVTYRMTGLVRVYADAAEINLRVWGDQWPVALDHLAAGVRLPAAVPRADAEKLRVWGHPRTVEGVVARDDALNGAHAQAVNVLAHQWVELRVIFPPSLLDPHPRYANTSASMQPALDRILREENAADAQVRARARRVAWIRRHLWLIIPGGLLALFVPALVVFAALGRRYGRDPRTPDVDYVREPPSDDSPALVGALMREGGRATTTEFCATIFDLIRRGYFRADHETTEETTWMGLRHEVLSDLRVRPGAAPPADLPDWDGRVYQSVLPLIEGDGELLSQLGDGLRRRAKDFYKEYTSWQASVRAEIGRRKWIDKSGYRLWGVGIAVFVVVALAGVATIAVQLRTPGAIPLLGIAVMVPGAVGAVLLGVLGAAMPRALTRRTKQGAELSAKWRGLRRYLADFSAMDDAPPASLALWEGLLVYGIVLGVADRVLRAAHLRAPPDLVQQSNLYWMDGNGLGGGLTSLHLASLSSGVSHAVSAGAPSSSGFSGGGGFGGGGGGGGAW